MLEICKLDSLKLFTELKHLLLRIMIFIKVTITQRHFQSKQYKIGLKMSLLLCLDKLLLFFLPRVDIIIST